MDKNNVIRDAQDRIAATYKRRPSLALSTVTASGSLEHGLQCTVTQGGHTVTMDVGTAMGGDDAGPTPGFYARAGVIGCVSIGIKMTAVRQGLDLKTIHVDIETDFDDGAPLGIGENTAAPLQTRLKIRIETDEPEAEVSRLVEEVLTRDPWFLALKDPQSVRTDLEVVAAQ